MRISAHLATSTAIVTACLLCASVAAAKKPQPPSGGDGANYVIVELPNVDPDSGLLTEHVSDVSADGTVYVVGANGGRACLWTVGPTRTAVAEDLGDWLHDNGLEVNSAGIISGRRPGDYTPVLLMPNRQLVNLPGATDPRIRINNPDEFGVFQAVSGGLLWDVSVDGTVLGTTVLVDALGTPFVATDINDAGQMAGFVMQGTSAVPAIGAFAGGELLTMTLVNPNPAVIVGFSDMEISGAGDVLGEGYEPAGTEIGSVYPRGVIWRVDGGTVDLGVDLNVRHADGKGIATVNGSVQCVGKYFRRDSIAFVYAGGAYLDLQQVSEGERNWLEIFYAGGINSSGMICGSGKVGRRRDYDLQGCLLIPVAP